MNNCTKKQRKKETKNMKNRHKERKNDPKEKLNQIQGTKPTNKESRKER